MHERSGLWKKNMKGERAIMLIGFIMTNPPAFSAEKH